MCVHIYIYIWASLSAQMVKNLPAMLETRVRSLDQEDPLEKGMATLSSILAWRIPSYSPWDHKESDTTEQLTHTYTYIYFFLPFFLKLCACLMNYS